MKLRLVGVCILTLAVAPLFSQPLKESQNFLKSSGLRFEENKGQVSENGVSQNDVLFTMKDKGMLLFFRKDGITYQWFYNEDKTEDQSSNEISEATGKPVGARPKQPAPERIDLYTFRSDMKWIGSQSNVEIVAEDAYEDLTNYYLAHIPNGVTGVKSYQKITYKNLYPNTDVAYYIKDGHLKYDIILHAGSDPDLIQFAFSDVDTRIDNGKLSITSSLGFITEEEPIAFVGDEKVGIHFKASGNKIGFAFDHKKQLFNRNSTSDVVIDPVILWGTYYGGTGDDYGGKATAITGGVSMAGATSSTTAIASGGFQNTIGGNFDAFTVKFTMAGVRQWATYIGGTASDFAFAMTYWSGYTSILGFTQSTAGIASGGHQNTFGGVRDAFVVSISDFDGIRRWSTYYGGTGEEWAYSIDNDSEGNIYFSGETRSTSGIASTGAFQTTNAGGDAFAGDAFLVKMNLNGVRQWGTYYGGTGQEYGYAVTVQKVGVNLSTLDKIYLGGTTGGGSAAPSSSGLATAGAHQTSPASAESDAFIVKFGISGAREWATYYGGTGVDDGFSLTWSNGLFFTGTTGSATNIASGGFNNTWSGEAQVFLVKFSDTGVRQWGTYHSVYDFGGYQSHVASYQSHPSNNSGIIYLSAVTSRSGMASGGLKNSPTGDDVLLSRFNSSGAREWSTYIGGEGQDVPESLAIGWDDNIYLSGFTASGTGISFGGVHQTTNAGGADDAFMMKIEPSTSQPATQPTDLQFTSITQTSYTVSFTPVTGVQGYVAFRRIGQSSTFLPVDGTTYTVGTSYGNGLAVYNGPNPTFTQNAAGGLVAGTNYYYDVFAYNGNGGTMTYNYLSTSPLEGDVFTLAPTVVASAATSITTRDFTINWNASTSATNYRVDLSSDNFATFLTGFNNRSVAGTSVAVTTNLLNPGTTYQYRVRAENESGISPNSNVISTITLSSAPVLTGPTAITASGYTISWAAVTGASGYFLDVSTDNFVTFVSGFNNLAVTGTSRAIAGLSAGTTYQARLRAGNASGSSANSNVIAALTIPPAPVATAAGSVTLTGFTGNWNAAASATSYRFDVSTNNFSSFVTGFNNLTVAGLSQAVASLTKATAYQYRVRAVNASGTSANSNTITITTLSDAPVTTDATVITDGSFTANWATVVGAVSYNLDVSTDNFATFVTGFQNKNVAGTSQAITGLTGNTTYSYRVRSINASAQSSANSNVTTVLTKPSAPTVTAATNETTTFLDANWTAPPGPTAGLTYELDVSKEVDKFSPILKTYTDITGTTKRVDILVASTDYLYRVRAVNATGASVNSSEIRARTEDITATLSMSAPATSNVAKGFAQKVVTTNVTGGSPPVTVTGKYRTISGTDYQPLTVTDKGSGAFEATIAESLLTDEMGVEFYFEGTDQAGTKTETQRGFLYWVMDAAQSTIPFKSGFNGKSGTYQMFSVPYLLNDKSISSVFDEFGEPDKTVWRVFHWTGDKYVEYPGNLTNIEPGKAYWFNTKNEQPIKAGAGVVTNANQITPFKITLQQGWNQVGDPYPFKVLWSKVVTDNASAGLNSLWVFDGGYTKSTTLDPWKGGFVHSDNGGEVTFHVAAKTNGRIGNDEELPLTPDERSWMLPITLELNEMKHVGAIGMDPSAKQSKDRFDEIALPRFIDYIEMNTYHSDFFSPYFSSDIVPTATDASWIFTVSSNHKSGNGVLRWDRDAMANSTAMIAIIDLESGVITDMRTVDHFAFNFSEGKQLKFVYNSKGELHPGVTLLGTAFPNPFTDRITMPVLLGSHEKFISIDVFDMLGRKVTTISRSSLNAGAHEIEWDGRNEKGLQVSSGMYIYHLRSERGIISTSRRLIKH